MRSEDLTNASWTKTAVTAAIAGVNPAPSIAGCSLVASVANTNHMVQQTIAAVAGLMITVSVWAKPGDKSWVLVSQSNGNDGVWFDVTNGTIGTQTRGVGVISAAQNGFYLLRVTFTVANVGGNVELWSSPGNGAVTFAGDGATVNSYFAGAQVSRIERPAYVKTAGAAVSATNYPRQLNTDPQNILSRSDDFGNAYWSKFQISVTSDAVVGPFSGTMADALVEDGNAGEHGVFHTSLTDQLNRPFCFSAYAKKGTRDWLLLLADNGNHRFWFNLNTGVVGIAASLNASTVANYITAVGGGWYLCEGVSSSLTVAAQSTIEPASGNGVLGYVGSNGAQSLYVWQAQQSYANRAGPPVITVGGGLGGTLRNLSTRNVP